MPANAHTEILARDWIPPVVLGRAREVDEVVRRLDPPVPHAPPPWVVAVAGPSGSGTSAIARRAAREVADRIRGGVGGPFPRLLSVRTPFLRGPHGVATGLLQLLDEGFDGRGFPAAEILAGLLRRIRRDGRPTIVLLDDVGVGGPELGPVVRAFAEPDRFLPEGESGLPPLWVVLAGTPEALEAVDRSLGARFRVGPPVQVAPYETSTLRAIVEDRAGRALGHPAALALIDRVVDRAVADGGSARQAVELLRRELLGLAARDRPHGLAARLSGISVEPRVVRAIGVASQGKSARLADVKRLEAELARAQGTRPLPTTTLWRRIVRLEQAGYVRREIRPGGNGGTLSLVRVLTPIDEWVTTAHRSESRRAGAPWSDPGGRAAAEDSGALRAMLGRFPGDP